MYVKCIIVIILQKRIYTCRYVPTCTYWYIHYENQPIITLSISVRYHYVPLWRYNLLGIIVLANISRYCIAICCATCVCCFYGREIYVSLRYCMGKLPRFETMWYCAIHYEKSHSLFFVKIGWFVVWNFGPFKKVVKLKCSYLVFKVYCWYSF